MSDYSRPKEGFRFKFGGMKTNSAPDSMPPDKYPIAVNIRSYSDSSVRTRPGTTKLFQAGPASAYFTDVRAYATLGTDDQPRLLGFNLDNSVWIDAGLGTQVGSLAGGSPIAIQGASLIPFRPNQSPNPYMYIANGSDYQKFSAPTLAGVVTQQKVGIAEPQVAPDMLMSSANRTFTDSGGGSFWTNVATAGASAAGNRITDTVGPVLPDPAIINPFTVSIGVTAAAQYQRMLPLSINGVQNSAFVLDVFAGFTSTLSISSIFYFSGVTGRCIIVPSVLQAQSGAGGETSIYLTSLLFALRRGALIKVGTETCYVWSVTEGPDGTVSIETSTTLAHSVADSITAIPAVQIFTTTLPIAGQAISATSATYVVTVGIGTQTATLNPASPGALNPFGFPSAQPDDYFYIGIKVDNLANLNEMKILFDVGDGTFTRDFFYVTFRPSDITAAIANSVTQIASAQTVDQRATIDDESSIGKGNSVQTSSSQQLTPGNNTWIQLIFPLTNLTRVGGDLTKNLQNATKMQILWNASGTINVATGSFGVSGGSAPDVGDVGAPYRYRVRPRSSVTGAVGNPSPATRYGISPRRQAVLVILPSGAYDPQIDTWDIERYGGSVTEWRRIASMPLVSQFIDIFSDDAAGAGEALDFDNHEPWPTIDVPLNATATQVTGTVALVTIPSPTNVLRYLPGNLVQIALGNVYTLRKRPVLVGGTTYLFEFEENANSPTVPAVFSIYEPLTARQFLPYMWGPDVNGTVFAVGDPLRPGTLYFAKNNQPDSAPDSYNIEISPPTEPLLGGEVVDGLSFVGSTERWWALYPQPDNPLQRYNFVQQPITRGLGAPFGHCNDGKEVFFWGKDGIYGTSRGSLTDADLFNLFPHEGIPGQDVTYNGVTIHAPAYQNAPTFRLAHSNGWLYATYQDSAFVFRVLVCNLRTGAWSVDLYPFQVSAVYHVEQQKESSSASNAVTVLAGRTVGAPNRGAIYQQNDLFNDDGTNGVGNPIACSLATFEFDGGDVRAGEQWGDLYLDSLPAAKGSPLTMTPMNLGVSISVTQTIPQRLVRVQQPVSLVGGVLSNFLGTFYQWADDFSQQSVPTTLYVWQPALIPKPENIIDRQMDWDDAGIEGAKWIQGFILHADTFAAAKGIIVRDADALAAHAFTPVVNHNGEKEIAYSFNQPFIAHMVRLEPQPDGLPMRIWKVRWIAEETPESAETWTTQPTSHGMQGFMYVRQVSITYSSTTPVTLTIGVFDGTAPAPIIMPSTGGLVKKLVFVPTFNKGQLYTYSMTSTAPFAVHQDKCEVLVGAWGRQDGYTNKPLVGERSGDEAKI